MAAPVNDLRVGPSVLAEGVTTIVLDFQVDDVSELVVTKSSSATPLVLTTDYTFAGVGTATGVVTLLVAADGVDSYTAYLEPTLGRESDLQFRGAFRSGPINNELNRLWRAIQATARDVGGAFLFTADSDIPDALQTLSPAGRIGKALGFTSDGTGLALVTENTDTYLNMPLTSVDNAVARWGGTSGLELQSSGVLIDDSDNVTIPGDLAVASANPTITFVDSDVPDVRNELSLNGAFMTVDLDMDSNTSAAGFNVDYQGDRLFGVSHLGAHIGAQVSAENRTLTLNGNDAIKLPTGTTAQRPAGAEEGDLRGNSTDNAVEYFNGAEWVALGGASARIVVDYQEFLTSGTWSKPAAAISGDKVLVQVVGGGGAGDRDNLVNNPGGGGGGGGAVHKYNDVDDLGATEAVVVGAGGAGASGSGSDGGDSSFGTPVTSGLGYVSAAVYLEAEGGLRGTTGARGEGGNIRHTRADAEVDGTPSPDGMVGGHGGISGNVMGGNSIWGGGGGGGYSFNNGGQGGGSVYAGRGGMGPDNTGSLSEFAFDGEFPGGGGGAVATNLSGTSVGGSGADGVVRVWVIRE